MKPFRKRLIFGFLVLFLLGCSCANCDTLPGFLEGHLNLASHKEVELAESSPSPAEVENYGDYPLIILSKAGEKEVARVTPDRNGNYRVALPPGDYVLDVQGRKPKGHLRAKPQPFTIVSSQTARVDIDVDPGVR
jgi:hypothetical protein